MGETNADRLRAGVEAYNAGDFDRALAMAAENVTFKRLDGLPDERGTVRGRDRLHELFLPDAWSRQHLDLVEVVEEGDIVLVRGRFHAEGAASGIELDVETFAVYRFNAEGLLESVENWRTREEAERSAGLRYA